MATWIRLAPTGRTVHQTVPRRLLAAMAGRPASAPGRKARWRTEAPGLARPAIKVRATTDRHPVGARSADPETISVPRAVKIPMDRATALRDAKLLLLRVKAAKGHRVAGKHRMTMRRVCRRDHLERADRHGAWANRVVRRRVITRTRALTRGSSSSGSIRMATGSFPKRNSPTV